MTELEFESETINLVDAAKFLLISTDTLMDMARAGTIPSCKIGRRWVFMKSLLVEYVRRRSMGDINVAESSSSIVQKLNARREEWAREKRRRSQCPK
jgi:excisionase family DNA binding protein